MKGRDNIVFGLIIGSIIPPLGFIFISEIDTIIFKDMLGWTEGVSIQFQWIVSLMFNLIPFGVLNKHGKESTMRGIVFATLIIAVVIAVVYWEQFKYG